MDDLGRESTKIDENLCRKRWAGVKGLKNGPKMPQNPFKKLKKNDFIEILEIPEIRSKSDF